MNTQSPLTSSKAFSSSEEVNATSPADDRERRENLIRILGEPICRRLGVYHIPDGFVLSVVIPVYNGRDYKEGKKIGWKDGVQALYCIFRYAFAD
jgi:hypothetical protein